MRAKVDIVIADGLNKSSVSFETNELECSFDETAAKLEADFLSPETFMTIDGTSGKTIIRKSLVSVVSITKIAGYLDC
jgi:hypothetical protein